ncbi:3-deoxy-D-manno-octulosonic acid transferase [Phaeovulum sp.]|uniref:3-deoxy-D-manno-octulosonic acid transferase n=1 Tax=Phaeovulum sp. TaxID=2934796 RepID=UPI0039E47B07
MARPFPTWLNLATRSRKPRLTVDAPTTPRPEGPLVWLHATTPAAHASAGQLARHISHARPGLAVLLSEQGLDPGLAAPKSANPSGTQAAHKGPPTNEIIATAPPTGDDPALARAFIDHWHPDLSVFVATTFSADTPPTLPTALIEACHAKGHPLMLCDTRLPATMAQRFNLKRPLLRALLGRFRLLLVQDQISVTTLTQLGVPADRIEAPGTVSETAEPLPCFETERAAIALTLRARPVWLAMAPPAAEEAAVLAAHSYALRHAHRMLLILLPEDPGRGAELADQLQSEGWSVARRTEEGEPDEDTQILIADDPSEPGLWYRLAPVTYMGGTLSGTAINPHSPLEPAALGSAILHGPQTVPFAAEYARLGEARAARLLADENALAMAVADLIAPDKAAALAHNAWAVTSGGSGVAETVVRKILALLDNPRAEVG